MPPPPPAPEAEGVRIDAATVRRWCVAAVQALGAHRDEIDDLNVYPVPDGDTGTNMLLTLRAMTDALRRERPAALAAAAAVIARGALLGARGNSGVILSQFIRGMAEVLGALVDGQAVTDAPGLLAKSIRRGAERARAGVADPAEGTILTVADRAADAALATAQQVAQTMEGVAAVSTAAAQAAAEAVRRTPEQLKALRVAGVVDAGGRGLSIIFDALAAATGGTPAGGADWARRTPLEDEPDEWPHSSEDYEYEVVYLLETRRQDAERLTEQLRELGDSVVVATADDDSDAEARVLYKVHVHVNDIGAAIERGVEAGRLRDIEVTRFAGQPVRAPAGGSVGIVAIAPGDALREVFEAEGAVVVDSGSSRRPSTAEVLQAIERTGAPMVVVLPNDRDTSAVADAAAGEAREAGIEVAVVPTKSLVQGLAAIAVHEPERYFGDDVMAMADAAAGTRYAEVTVAVREALTMAGTCQPGDVLGLVEADVITIGPSILEVTMTLLDMLLATGGELVTLVIGRRAPDGLAEDLASDLSARHPEVEVAVLAGGHLDHPVLLGVE
ncbi:DAK2 domain-containing protein [Blastococcus sp. Marseille-P5729]|uniref:DAK2 domain-containing protein n=1 Tax=Blastococcus sp. Marseille-P5729 TaxID=2086582 RepID=UPI000D107652|nr:DAK2 domain-containing protein [Blastococcus sp. Marseille-P5729]